MKILLLSYYFPPSRSIGALRVGKLAKYLHHFGYEVRVISAANQWWNEPLPKDLPVEIPDDCLILVDDVFVNRLRTRMRSRRRPADLAPPSRMGTRTRAVNILRDVLFYPDMSVEWGVHALFAAFRTTEHWHPDAIIASALPPTAFFVAATLSRLRRIPWVAEYRDLWSMNPYYSHGSWRRPLDRAIERRLLASAAGVVTVTEGLAHSLRTLTDRPIAVIRNGFDPDDFTRAGVAVRGGTTEACKLRIVHTGTLLPGVRDPRLLFEAVSTSNLLRENVQLEFAGRSQHWISQLAAEYGVQQNVTVHGDVDQLSSIRLQASANLLLLIVPPTDKDALPGKLFEYIGGGRYILCLGEPEYEVSSLITEHGVGQVFNDAGQLRSWLEDVATGRVSIPSYSDARREEFTREASAHKYVTFLDSVL